MLKCLIEGTGNNVFMSILNEKKKLVFRCTVGLISMSGSRFRGTKKKTIFGAEQIGKYIGRRLVNLGYKALSIVVCFKWKKGERGCVRGLIRSGININGLYYKLTNAHNGVRYKKVRRK